MDGKPRASAGNTAVLPILRNEPGENGLDIIVATHNNGLNQAK